MNNGYKGHLELESLQWEKYVSWPVFFPM